MENDIKCRNNFGDDEKLNAVHKYLNKKSNLWTIIAEVNATSYNKLMNKKKVFVRYTSCRIYDDYNVNMC